jgi:ribosome maturation factor RimP
MNLSEDDLRGLVSEQAAEDGLVLVEIKLARHKASTIVRVFADRQGGITVGECARLSRRLALVLENRSVFDGRYVLEVSSPGLERPLKTAEDFELKVGENIRLYYMDDSDANRQLEGKLEAAANNRVTIVTEDGQFDVELDRISKGQIIL